MSRSPHELSHLVRLDRLGATPMTVVLEPDSAVRATLAERFGLPEVKSLRAELEIRRRPETGWIELSGRVDAHVVQTCVVTTDPVAATVSAELSELFDDSSEAGDLEVVVDPLADTPEPIADESLDVGEIAAQAFGLALDPYPRSVDFASVAAEAEPEAPEGASPFGKLAALRDRAVKKG